MTNKLPINISDFAKLRRGNYLYVDKTEHVYKLITSSENYFLSRPRRFGKSLLITMLRDLFSGNKDLFKDLWIEKHSGYDWPVHPVIHLDFSTFTTTSVEQFIDDLCRKLDAIAASYAADLTPAQGPKSKVVLLIEKLAATAPAVVLIDEYDYPLLRNIEISDIFIPIHRILQDFYAGIKSKDTLLRAVFLTGVTKFAKTSIFSGMNNLVDLTLDPRAASLLGYTSDEIHHTFQSFLNEKALQNNTTVENLMNQIAKYYNGYRFSGDIDTKVFNPYSLLFFLQSGKFTNYWFQSATPSFLIKLLKKQKEPLKFIDKFEISEFALDAFEADSISLAALLFQTGYVTIIDYDPTAHMYTMASPNQEVRQSFENHLLTFLTDQDLVEVSDDLVTMKTDLQEHNFDDFFTGVQSFLASIPYQIVEKKEKYYHSLFALLMRALSLKHYSELLTDKGRIDTVIETKNDIFIFELKIDQTPQAALQQIKDKKYYERFLRDHKKITLIGVNFDTSKKGITVEHAVEPFSF